MDILFSSHLNASDVKRKVDVAKTDAVRKINSGKHFFALFEFILYKFVYRMAGVFVLLAFVLLVFILGACLMIICYQRSKNNERREAKEAYEYGYGSQVSSNSKIPE